MRATVIHAAHRLDRAAHVGALHALLPALTLTPAVAPLWVYDAHNRAVRGCSLAHLQAVAALPDADEALLVLEDDAVVHPPGWDAWRELQHQLPRDAGAILLGTETSQHGAVTGAFVEVLPPLWGSHAVVYCPALLRSRWLLNAYALLASSPIGEYPGLQGLCYESVILLALQGTGLKLYRPQTLAFTAAAGYSDRERTEMPARDRNLSLK